MFEAVPMHKATRQLPGGWWEPVTVVAVQGNDALVTTAAGVYVVPLDKLSTQPEGGRAA